MTMADFLNKTYTKAIFSADSTLNLTFRDLAEDAIDADISGEIVSRLNAVYGDIPSMNPTAQVAVNIRVRKDSPSLVNYYSRIENNAIIGGTLTLYDDVNQAFTIEKPSLSLQRIENANGQNPFVQFIVNGYIEVNREIWQG